MSKGSVNKVILIGNLGAEPEVRYMQSGDAVANVRIATSESWRDRNTGETQERTEWHNVVFFERMASHLERAGAGIERHFPDPTAMRGRGVALLRRGYALTLGLWQMSAAIGGGMPPIQPGPEVPMAFAWSYPEELEQALRALWQGMLVTAETAEGTR